MARRAGSGSPSASSHVKVRRFLDFPAFAAARIGGTIPSPASPFPVPPEPERPPFPGAGTLPPSGKASDERDQGERDQRGESMLLVPICD